MLCKSLNIKLCPICVFKSVHDGQDSSRFMQSDCWIEWWGKEFKLWEDVKTSLVSTIKTEGFEGRYFIYLKEAIKLYKPEYSEYLEKITLLI